MITLDVLEKRRDKLSHTKEMSLAELDILRERVKVINKEVANITGAIIDIDHMIQSL